MGGNKVRCDTVWFGNELQAKSSECSISLGATLALGSNQPYHILASVLSLVAMRPELGAKSIMTSEFLEFNQVPGSGRKVNFYKGHKFGVFV